MHRGLASHLFLFAWAAPPSAARETSFFSAIHLFYTFLLSPYQLSNAELGAGKFNGDQKELMIRRGGDPVHPMVRVSIPL